jgi:uncharacterized SAM-binding protein YcdF (DUF218 family)
MTSFGIPKLVVVVCFLVLIGVGLWLVFPRILRAVGSFPVRTDRLVVSDAVVVLNSGVELYPRLMEAAALFREGLAARVVINGNRKSDVLRDLEKMGYQACCPWSENSLRILEMLGVAREHVVAVDAEDAYDTITEAKAVGPTLVAAGMSSIIVVTSKYHTRRSGHVWERLFSPRLQVRTAAAREDPYSPTSWWKHGRQIRWVLAEYGAWIFYFWNQFSKT